MLNKKTEFTCAICNKFDMSLIMDFGEVALAGAFLKPENFAKEKKFPMRLFFCNNCFTVQVVDKIDPKIMFQDYFYFSSSIETLRDHFKEYALWSRKFLNSSSKIIELGSNDGTFLSNFKNTDIQSVGFEPSKNVSDFALKRGIKSVNKFFSFH